MSPRATLATLALAPLAACDRSSGTVGASVAFFTDVTASSGLAFRHVHGGSGRKFLVETMGSGVAWLDFDGDHDLDLDFAQGAALPGFAAKTPLHNTLWRNDGGRFVEVAAAAGVADSRFGLGVAAPDYDNDGDADLYLTNFGPNALYRNDGGGRFTDVTARAGVADGDRFHASCCFGDFDRDQDLDLYVVAYVDMRLDDGKVCADRIGGQELRSYCHPDNYRALDDSLYRNNGDGTFTDVSKETGLVGKGGNGLGIAAADYDRDGDLDLFVADDSDVSFLWRNDGEMRFTDVAPELGVDYDGEGKTQAHMGTAFGDVDDDLDWDLFTVNLSNEYNTLFLWEDGTFVDRSYPTGLAAPSLPFVGFGTVLGDFDNDGDLDVVVANGHILDNAELVAPGTTYRQVPHLYLNDGKGRFRLASAAEAGPYFAEPHVGRGLAAADFDDDGDLDLVVSNNDEEARLLRNDVGARSSWIGIELVGTVSNRAAIGAEVLVRSRSGTQLRQARAAESYLSFHDLRVLVGLGQDEGPVDVEIRWPDGRVQEVPHLPVRRYCRIEEPR